MIYCSISTVAKAAAVEDSEGKAAAVSTKEALKYRWEIIAEWKLNSRFRIARIAFVIAGRDGHGERRTLIDNND